MSKKLRIGIAGRRGTAFYSGLRAVEGVELAAICDLDEPWLRAEAQANEIPFATTRYEELLEQVDAVVVATPMQLHVPHAVMALQAGRHVMSEVTAAISIEECWRLIEAVERSEARYMLSENYCYIRDNVLVRELVREGLFGEPYYGEGEYLHDVKHMHHTPDGRPTWRYYWQVGTSGSTYPTHSLGPAMQWITAFDPSDRIVQVNCVGCGRHTDPEHPHDDTTNMLVSLRSGRMIRVRIDMMSNRPHQMSYYALQGTHGAYEAARIAGQPGHVWFGSNPSPGPVPDEDRQWRALSEFEEHLPEHWRNPPTEALKAGHGGGDYWVVKDFVDTCHGVRPSPIDVYTACEWTAAGLCSQISVANGGVPIRVPNFRDRGDRPLVLDAPEVKP